MQEFPFPDRVSGVRDDPFHEQSFAAYWKTLALPTLLALITLVLARQRVGGFAPWQVALAEVALFLVLNVLLARQQRTTAKHLMTMNVLAGSVLGLGLAIENLVQVRAFYAVFQLITEPVGTALLGMLIGWIGHGVSQRLRLPIPRLHHAH